MNFKTRRWILSVKSHNLLEKKNYNCRWNRRKPKKKIIKIGSKTDIQLHSFQNETERKTKKNCFLDNPTDRWLSVDVERYLFFLSAIFFNLGNNWVAERIKWLLGANCCFRLKCKTVHWATKKDYGIGDTLKF